MRVFDRIGRMVRADAHGMMDQLEERSLMLKQSLREAELEVANKRTALEALDDERQNVKEEGRRLEARVAALDEDVELALAGGDSELARFAVKRLLPRREALKELFAHAARLDERRARLQQRIAFQEAQLVELRPRVRAALAKPQASASEFEAPEVVTDEEVELELLRRRGAGEHTASAGEGAR